MRISSKWMSGFCEEFLKYGRQSFIEIRAPSILAANGPNLAALVPRQKKEMEKVISCFEAFCSSAPDKIFTSELIDWLITKCVEGFDVDRPAGERIVEQL